MSGEADSLAEELIARAYEEATYYGSLLRRRKVPEVDEKVAELILKHLMFNSARPSECTIRAIERRLGIPYSRVRRVVRRLVEEGVLEEVALGRSHVLRVTDLERAFIKGYLRPSSEEMLTYVILSIPPLCRVEGYTPTEQLLRSMPKVPLTLPQLSDLLEVAFLVQLVSYAYASLVVIRSVEERLRACGESEAERLKERLRRAKANLEEVAEYLRRSKYGHLANELLSPQRVERTLTIIREYGMEDAVARVGGRLLDLPFVRLTMLPTPLELHLSRRRIEEGGLRGAEPLAHIPYALPGVVGVLCALFLLRSERRPGDVVDSWREVMRTLLRLYIEFLKPVCRKLEESGLEGLMESEPRGYWCPQQLMFESIALRYAVLSAISIGVEEELVEEGARVALALERAALLGYRGAEREGCDLFTWAKRLQGEEREASGSRCSASAA